MQNIARNMVSFGQFPGVPHTQELPAACCPWIMCAVGRIKVSTCSTTDMGVCGKVKKKIIFFLHYCHAVGSILLFGRWCMSHHWFK